jgi:hypothetical protein
MRLRTIVVAMTLALAAAAFSAGPAMATGGVIV